MGKRKWDDEEYAIKQNRPVKRARCGSKESFLDLSDELIVRILSYLSIRDITKCESVNRKLGRLAIDNEIWREKFFVLFVRPRARRIPSVITLNPQEREAGVLNYSSRLARWLEHSNLSRIDTDWKREFKVKSNWTRGLARSSEMDIGKTSSPSVLAKVHQGIIFTVDNARGLRSWQRSRLLHSLTLRDGQTPTAMALSSKEDGTVLAVGFLDGSISLFSVDKTGAFLSLGSIESVVEGPVSCLAMAWPYLLSMSTSGFLALHHLLTTTSESSIQVQANCLTTLSSDAKHGPMALSLRKVNMTIIASIVYSFYRINAGWCFGLQELRMTADGIPVSSRLASTIETPMMEEKKKKYRPQRAGDQSVRVQIVSRSAASEPLVLHPKLMQPPNALSFSGCYILAALSDNTLMLYTIKSTNESLEINVGRRLWGHTSAVAAAEVTSNGKALSISAKSSEMRYWELEDLLSTFSPKQTSTPIKSWTELNEALARRGNGLGLALKHVKRELELTRRWVGFDEEQAVILGERDQRQVLSYFDFA